MLSSVSPNSRLHIASPPCPAVARSVIPNRWSVTEAHNATLPPIEQPKTIFEQPVKEPIMHEAKEDYKPTSMYVSYAKDIFVAVFNKQPDDCQVALKDTMNWAILLVKQAEKEFRLANTGGD